MDRPVDKGPKEVGPACSCVRCYPESLPTSATPFCRIHNLSLEDVRLQEPPCLHLSAVLEMTQKIITCSIAYWLYVISNNSINGEARDKNTPGRWTLIDAHLDAGPKE